jgi:DNA-binding MarR family transcriptional regulator
MATTTAATIADLMAAFAVTRVQNARVVSAMAVEHGIGPTDLRALSFLSGQDGGATPKHVAEHLGLTTGAMTTLTDRIEQRGLVRRIPNPDDRRSLVLELTPAGRTLMQETSAVYARAFAQAMDGLDLDEVRRGFEAVGAALRAIADERDVAAGAAAE